MRFVVVGAGAVGGVVGGRLLQHGHHAVLVARGAHLEALQAGGLRLLSPDDDIVLNPPVVGSVAEVDWRHGDVVLLAVKGQDTLAVVEELSRVAPAELAVVCLQNGVENERVALRRFADVYGVTVMLPAAHHDPGVVMAFSSPTTGLLDVGRYPNGSDGVADEIAAVLGASSFDSVARPDIMRWKYTKLLMNLANSVEAACGPEARLSDLAALVREEGAAVLDAAGIDRASDDEERERRGDLLSLRPIEGQRRGGGSSWQSLARGTGGIETDFLNGEVVLLGRLHGVPTPANALMQRVARAMAAAGSPAGSLEESDLLARLAPSRTRTQ